MLTDFRDADGTPVPASVYYEALTHTHHRRVRVRVMDLDHGRTAWLPEITAGLVTINTTNREASRVADVTLFDPSQSIGWEPNSAAAMPQHLKRMIQIVDERSIDGYGWVGCPTFTGPISEFDRSGADVRLVAEGKDRLALRSFGRAHHWKKGRKITDIIREILLLSGEKASRIHVPDLNNTLHAPGGFSVSVTDRPLVAARRLAARAGDRVVFYDGRGHVVMRRRPEAPALPRLDENWLMGPVRIDRRKLEFKNGWKVLGVNPPGEEPRVTSGLIGLPKNNPISAYALRRNGKWGWEIRTVETQVKTNEKARRIAFRMRDEQVKQSADVSLDILPLPNIEEYDLLRAVDPLTGHVDVRVQQATIPLVGGVQTIGAVKRTPVPRRR